MSILNRRNALLGYLTWQGVKGIAKRKARSAVPGRGDHAGLNKSAIASIAASVAAAVGGVFWFWRKKSEQASATSE